MSDQSTQSSDLGSRYGGPSPVVRVVALVVIAGLVLSGAGLLGWAVLSTSTPQVQSQVTAYEFPTEHQAIVRVTVVRESETTQATCVLTAIAEDHSTVGQRQILVSSGPKEQVLEVTIETERRATAIDTPGCTTPDQPRPR